MATNITQLPAFSREWFERKLAVVVVRFPATPLIKVAGAFLHLRYACQRSPINSPITLGRDPQTPQIKESLRKYFKQNVLWWATRSERTSMGSEKPGEMSRFSNELHIAFQKVIQSECNELNLIPTDNRYQTGIAVLTHMVNHAVHGRVVDDTTGETRELDAQEPELVPNAREAFTFRLPSFPKLPVDLKAALVEEESFEADSRWQELLRMHKVKPGDTIFYEFLDGQKVRRGTVQENGSIELLRRGQHQPKVYIDPVALVLGDNSYISNPNSVTLREHSKVFEKCELIDEDDNRVPLPNLLDEPFAASGGGTRQGAGGGRGGDIVGGGGSSGSPSGVRGGAIAGNSSTKGKEMHPDCQGGPSATEEENVRNRSREDVAQSSSSRQRKVSG